MNTSSRFVACAVLVLMVAALPGSAWGVPVIPNGVIDRDIVFTFDNGILGFDRSVGTLGALTSMPGLTGGGEIEPPERYGDGYTFDFVIESLLLQDQSDPNTGTAKGKFAAAGFTLTDRENANVVLLQGAIDNDFVLYEFFSFSQSLFAGNIPISISGGTLFDEFGPAGFIAFNLPVIDPSPLVGFSEDLYFTGSITLSVPEPVSCVLLGAGAMFLLRRRG
ncbi:MAG TPA: PEP-CTERM sorting domain-containing protein [Phycisphaerae bacterium]|nr:PEP-CTERM sorting domain-containing protein [Phycisphaerae bacterium]